MEEEKNEVEELKTKCEEYLNGWKRERADFLNYKKDETERVIQLAEYSKEKLILKLLPVLDNIYLAENHIADPSTGSGLREGLVQIKKQFLDILQKEGIEPIKTIGEPFDPNTMEAVEEVPASAPSSDGATTVVVEVQSGYTLHGKIIRVAKVKITK